MKAASNAHSWWWASHIRTKQSKWLEQNLQDMEEKVSSMLKIIDDDGDSFAKRAEMYYRKRPELVRIVEESYRAYQALAERYEHLSKDLQSANRTIATVFPEQVSISMDEEDEDNVSQTSIFSPSPNKSGFSTPNVWKVPFRNKDFRSQSMLSRKGQVKKDFDSAKAAAAAFPSSGLSKNEALDEIDKLQKEILAMQTEREFFKSSYEQGYQKFCEIDNQIIEKQRRVFNLQDEFGVGSVIDNNEARTLMATRALKSCQESLAKLKEKHEQSTEEARVESKRIKHVNQKFEALRNKFNSPQTNQQETTDVDNMVYEINSAEKEKPDLDALRKEIEEKLQVSSNAPLTMSQLTEKIDDLVQRVINLETAVFSENALVKRLKSDADELQEHFQSLEEGKEAQIKSSDTMSSRMNELEGELIRVKYLVKTVIDQINSLKTHFTEASCNINHLSEKLQAVNMDEEVDNTGLAQEEKPEADAKPDQEMEGKDKDVSAEGKNNVDSDSSNEFNTDSNKGLEPMEEDKAEKKYLSETASSIPDTEIEELETDEYEEQPNWRQLYLNGLDDRDTILLDEYSSVLRNYKEVQNKLNEIDKKNSDGFFELALQIREVKNAVTSRDGEIQSLHRKLSFVDENKDGNLVEFEASHQSPSQESTLTESIQASPITLGPERVGSTEKVVETPARRRFKESPEKMGRNILHVKPVSQLRSVLTVKNKIRSGIDELLEENLEFWLRFSTSFHQIQKYQTSVMDLKSELSTLRDKKKQGRVKQESLKSEIRPIYVHFREIKTELTLWLENNAVLKDEVQGRYSSLCNIQDEIARVTNVSGHAERETELTGYQAAKFQGEVLNMKQEINKVFDELKAGFDRVRQLKHEVEKVMSNLERELGASPSTNQQSKLRRSGPRIPLKSFLFGNKLKNTKQPKGSSMFTCAHPALQRQHSSY